VDVLRRFGECPKRNPQGGCLFLRESKRERGKKKTLVGLDKRKGFPASFTSRGLGPTRAKYPWTVRGAHADGPRGAWTVRHPGADSPLFVPEHPVLPLSPPSRADSPCRPGERSTRSRQIVRPTSTDSPTFLFLFSLIYSEIKTFKSIFWDLCSRLMKEICHMMQCTK
jgi:hypothetical protein